VPALKDKFGTQLSLTPTEIADMNFMPDAYEYSDVVMS